MPQPLTKPRTVTVAKQRFVLRRDQVEHMLEQVLPEPVASHYVVIGGRRYPPKQVINVLTGIDRADFTSHQARRILMGLGFAAGRLSREGGIGRRTEDGKEPRQAEAGAPPSAAGKTMRPSAEALAPFVGRWVATRGPEVLVAAGDPRAVVNWLTEHRQQADSVFRVPANEFEAGGLAPL